MGRGSSQSAVAPVAASRRNGRRRDQEMSAILAEIVELRVGSSLGLNVVGHGQLDESEHGHLAGTPYVEIGADCVDEAAFAEYALAEVARIPTAWRGGWESYRVNGHYELRRRIFPTLELLADDAASSA